MRKSRRVPPKSAPTGFASRSEPPATQVRTLNSSRSCLKVIETFRNGHTDVQGNNHFGQIGVDANGNDIYFWNRYPTYDWVNDNGYKYFGDWVEKAAKDAGR